jgi:cyanate permease
MGITTAGQGMGGFLLSPLSIFLISSLGWRMAWGVIGLLTWVLMIPTTLLVVKQKPEVMGLLIDGKESERGIISTRPKDNKGILPKSAKTTMKDILRTPVFWFVALLYILYLFGHLSIFQHCFSLFTDEGIPATTAGTMLGVLGLFSLSGKVVLGFLSDRISVRSIMMIALAFAAVSILPLFLAEPTWGAWLFIIFWGFWECGVIALQPILVATLFDRAIIGKMLGIFTLFSVLPQLIGPPFMGYIHDITEDYNVALFAFIGCYIVSLILVFFTHPSKLRLGSGLTGKERKIKDERI